MKKRQHNFADLTGLKFNLLTVLEFSHRTDNATLWKCLCDCGREAIIRGYDFKSGKQKSCGCLRDISTKKRMTTHGESHKTSEYKAWRAMHDRVYRPTTPQLKRDYKDRGITICQRWHVYENFISDMGRKPTPKHSLDRIDNNGNYEPLNCRWATRLQQNTNRRNTVFLTFKGEKKPLVEWVKITGISYGTLRSRLKKNPNDDHILQRASPSMKPAKT